jgi:SAM-dependent methyltransferase
MQGWDLELLACPRCTGPLTCSDGEYRCERCTRSYARRGGIAELRLPADARSETVRSFYTATPFPAYPPRDSYSWLRARAERSEFARLLDGAIPGDARVLELGCGTGQMSLFLATAERTVIGADLTRASLELGAAAARRFDVKRVRFVETDLRSPGLRRGAFDVVYSSGVLHHTPEPRRAFAAMAQLVKPGGIVVVGLYNTYARLPHRLRRLLARATGFRIVPFDPILRDRQAEPERRDAWFRDQYQHPEEHRHTLSEVQAWFRENDVDYLRTYPSTIIGEEPLVGAQLFQPAEDDWGFENLLAQWAWAVPLAREGGLFVTVGRRAA